MVLETMVWCMVTNHRVCKATQNQASSRTPWTDAALQEWFLRCLVMLSAGNPSYSRQFYAALMKLNTYMAANAGHLVAIWLRKVMSNLGHPFSYPLVLSLITKRRLCCCLILKLFLHVLSTLTTRVISAESKSSQEMLLMNIAPLHKTLLNV